MTHKIEVNGRMIEDYLRMLFLDVDTDEGGFIALRGIGENGTDKDGVFQEMLFAPVTSDIPMLSSWVEKHAIRWGANNVATYIVPAVMTSDVSAKSEDVKEFSAVVLDLDDGDTTKKLEHATKSLGKPTLVAHSGGKTKDGSPKLHAYWRLTEAENRVDRVAELRHKLAVLAGGDDHFGIGREHQPVRVPGTVHGKNGVRSLCEVVSRSDAEYDFLDLEDSVEAMSAVDGTPHAEAMAAVALHTPGSRTIAPIDGVMDFSSAPMRSINAALTTHVYEGGSRGESRFDSFSSVAGFYAHLEGEGKLTHEDAFEHLMAWVQVYMHPPWPEVRCRKEWAAIRNRESQKRLRMQAEEKERAWSPAPSQGAAADPGPRPVEDVNPLLAWCARDWASGDPPPREFIVDGLLPKGNIHAYIAEGGAGKSTMLLDLGLKVAAKPAMRMSESLSWMGGEVREGGTVILFTAEDDKDEVHRRIKEIDTDGLLYRAGTRLIVVPLLDAGGAFQLVQLTAGGTAIPTPEFARWFAAMKELDPDLVIFDTLSKLLHGSENDSTVINQWFWAATRVCAEIGSTVVFSHHVRKSGGDPITNPEEMATAVRGSNSILANVRSALGMWHAHDYYERMRKMGLEPRGKACYRAAVVKANNREMDFKVKTMVRDPVTGALADMTERDKLRAKNPNSYSAWLLRAITMAAEAGHPYTTTGKHGLEERKGELPEQFAEWGRRKFTATVNELISKKRLAKAQGSGILDAVGGRYAEGVETDRVSGAYEIPDWDEYYYDEDIDTVMKSPWAQG